MVWHVIISSGTARYCYFYLRSFRAATATVTVSLSSGLPPTSSPVLRHTDPSEKIQIQKIFSADPSPREFQFQKIIAKTPNLDWLCFQGGVYGWKAIDLAARNNSSPHSLDTIR